MKVDNSFKIRSLVLATVLNAGLSFVSPASALEHSYIIDLNSKEVTDLGSLGAQAINDAGQVVGQSNGHAFITGPNGSGVADLGTLGGNYSSAFGINNTGRVVGHSFTATGVLHAFFTGPNGSGMIDLGTLGGNSSQAFGINDRGQVVGSSDTVTGFYHTPEGVYTPFNAFITGANGVGMTDLGTLAPGPAVSSAFSINDSGQVVGTSSTVTGSYPYHAFITGVNGIGMAELVTLGGNSSQAYGINDRGQVVGDFKTITYKEHAFITGPNGTGMTDLGTLGGHESFARGINAAGQVVGESATSASGDPTDHAFVTGPNGVGMTDLNSLLNLSNGPIFTSAGDINNHGQVLAIGVIPEPASYALMLAGLALVGFMVRCKKHVDREAGRISEA